MLVAGAVEANVTAGARSGVLITVVYRWRTRFSRVCQR